MCGASADAVALSNSTAPIEQTNGITLRNIRISSPPKPPALRFVRARGLPAAHRARNIAPTGALPSAHGGLRAGCSDQSRGDQALRAIPRRALVLQAACRTYAEIEAETGLSHTKVNRALMRLVRRERAAAG
jgi:hypothetical protein